MVQADAPARGVFDRMLMGWNAQPYSELSVLISWLDATAHVHQVHHWAANADPFYGDHLLYERLYGDTKGFIDDVAEKAVGLGSSELVEPLRLSRGRCDVLETVYFTRPGIPQPTDLASRSLTATKTLIDIVEVTSDCLETKGQLTYGLDNMLAGVADKLEGHVYLLKARLART